ncbi:MAG: ABC transporter substrate-binding protein [Halobacteriovoraceae bacterium]|nr:ABC transporter substrate-binding protein [Halobacteriovoraceae bacterium]
MKKIVLGTTFTALILIGGIYHNQKQSNTKRVEIPYIKAVYSKPVSYDPAQMNDGASLIFSELVYEGLLRFTENYGIKAGIAESWETSEDGKTITFIINSKAKFHNGEKINANDVVASLSRVLAPESKVFKYYDMIKGADEYHAGKSKTLSGIKAIDKKTVTVELESPFPPILYVLAGGTAKILPANKVKNKDFFKKPIGAGPFKVVSESKTDITLTKFDKYHGESPKLSTIILRAIDQDSAMKQAKNGKLHDLSSWPLNGLEDVFKNGQDISTVVADTWIIGFNSRIAPLNDLKVRKSLQASIDNEKFRKTFYPSAAPAYGYVPQGFPGHIEEQPEKKSKVIVPPHTQITITIPFGLEKTAEIAAFFEKDLKEKGWNIKTEILEWTEMMKRYEEKTLHAFLVSMIVDYPDTEFLLNNFASNNPDNYSGVKDSIIDELLVSARKLQDRLKRYKVYEKLASRVNELALSANLFHSRPHYWIHKCVRNFEPNLLAVAYIDYRKVEFDSKCLLGGKK